MTDELDILAQMSVTALKKLAREEKIPGYSTLKTSEDLAQLICATRDCRLSKTRMVDLLNDMGFDYSKDKVLADLYTDGIVPSTPRQPPTFADRVRAVPRGEILDVTNLKENGSGSRLITRPSTTTRYVVHGQPLISSQVESMRLALKLLGQEDLQILKGTGK